MFYTKNVPGWERALRLLTGVAALVVAGLNWGTSAMVVGAALAGATLAITGLVGFCPMCAMAGRKIDKGG